MRQVFADTVFWVALLNPRDSLHAKAMQSSQMIPLKRIVTSEMVLTEVLNGLSGHGPTVRSGAARLAEEIGRRGDAGVISQTAEQFERALRLYKKTADKEWSLTDCASFLIMEEMGIQEALTHDQHFEQAGFEALLRRPPPKNRIES